MGEIMNYIINHYNLRKTVCVETKNLVLKTLNSIGTVTLCNLPYNDFLLKLQLHDKGFYTVQRFCSLFHNRLEVENRLGIIFKQQIFIGCSTEILLSQLGTLQLFTHFASFCAVVLSLYFALTIPDLRPLVSLIVYSLRNKLQTPPF